MSSENLNGARQETSNAPGNPEMRIIGVKTTELCSGIPLSGFESVAAALHTFASGRTRNGMATQDNIVGNISRGTGIMGLGYYFLSIEGIKRNPFVDKMLQDAEPAVQSRGYWSKHYDYDGMGTPFFKTTIEITRLPDKEDGYLLKLDASYVGREVQNGLAEALGIEQGLQWKEVNVTFSPEDQGFRIDFDQVAQRLQPLYAELQPAPESKNIRQGLTEAVKAKEGRPVLTGEAILQTMLSTNRYDISTYPFILGITDGVEVSLCLGRVGDRFDWRNGNREQELWKAEGAVLTGALAESYKNREELEPPSIWFYIRRHNEKDYNRLPAVDPQMKAKMNEIAAKIATAFQ